MTYFSNMPTQVHDLDLLLYFKNVPPGHDYLWVNANVNFRNLEFLYDISFDQTYWVEDLPFDRVLAEKNVVGLRATGSSCPDTTRFTPLQFRALLEMRKP